MRWCVRHDLPIEKDNFYCSQGFHEQEHRRQKSWSRIPQCRTNEIEVVVVQKSVFYELVGDLS